MTANEKIRIKRTLIIVSLFIAIGIFVHHPRFAVAETTVSEERDVGMFSSVDLRVPGNLYITQGEKQVLKLEGIRNLLDKCKAYVQNRHLVIETDSWKKYWSKKYINVYVTIPEITGLEISGSGNIIGKSKIVTDELGLKISGSGNIDMDVDADVLSTKIAGSGEIQLRGQAKKHRCKISGSGDLKSYGLMTENSEIKISGSGKCEVFVSQSLDAKISGSGKIYYRGDPNTVNLKTSGSGTIYKVE